MTNSKTTNNTTNKSINKSGNKSGSKSGYKETQRKTRLVQAVLLSTMFAGAFVLDPPVPQPDAVEKPAPTTAQLQYRMPAPAPTLPDFAEINDIDQKKQVFLDFLQPFIDAKNSEVRQQRNRLIYLVSKIKAGRPLVRDENRFIWELSKNYDVHADDLHDLEFLDRLLRRVDVLPPSLVLAQAATESGWGTSRFAREGNNLFGQWCYSQGCGLVPVRRHANASHEVKSFRNVQESINAYFKNLNTFPSYQDLRVIRHDLRQSAKPIDGISLTKGLGEYSERGEAYINEIQAMIRHNNLLARDRTLYP
jgi:Bax protein